MVTALIVELFGAFSMTDYLKLHFTKKKIKMYKIIYIQLPIVDTSPVILKISGSLKPLT